MTRHKPVHDMKLRLGLSFLSLAFSIVGAPTAAVAAECQRGTLDAKFCDADGDMVADAPTDAKQWVDPSTMVFA